MRYYFPPAGIAKIKKTVDTKCREDVEQLELSSLLLMGMSNGTNILENSLGVFYKVNVHLLCNPAIPGLQDYVTYIKQKSAKTKTKTCTRRTFLVVQWVRLHAPSAGGLGSIPSRGTRSHTHAATKGSHATTKKPACRS